jgi:hypothetical protein
MGFLRRTKRMIKSGDYVKHKHKYKSGWVIYLNDNLATVANIGCIPFTADINHLTKLQILPSPGLVKSLREEYDNARYE